MPKRRLPDWLSYIETVHSRSIDLGLDRVRAVAARLWPDPLPFPLIHVAGTNGKGSAVAMLVTILEQAGYQAGAYTSPHLVHYSERVRINGRMANDAELCEAFTVIEAARVDTPLTYFEFGTLAALWVFQRREVDIAVLEVGLGGRLDAVNAFEPVACLVTSVAIDHTQWLGCGREEIGAEKAGIFRAGRPAVCADPQPPASVAAIAEQVGADYFQLDQDFYFARHADSWDWLGPRAQHRGLPLPPLVGAVQLANAAGVLMMVTALQEHLAIKSSHLRSALPRVRLPGRFQVVSSAPEVILDVAHNPAAVTVLKNNLRERPIKGNTVAVYACLKDKPVQEIGRILGDTIAGWHIADLLEPRGCSAAMVVKDLGEVLPRHCELNTYIDVISAFDAARARCAPEDRIVVFGSFYTVGGILAHLGISTRSQT